MRSAIYYPQTMIRSEKMMRSSLLLWDRLHTIVPFERYRLAYKDRGMAEAWELIGKRVVPDEVEKRIAHRSLTEMLRRRQPKELRYTAGESALFEVWPQKFAEQTWELLRRYKLTDDPLPNADFPMTPEGGTLIMAKLADAIAGDALARVTDDAVAFGCATEPVKRDAAAQATLMTLEIVNAEQIPLAKLIKLRKRELKERRGYDYTAMRHRYADKVQEHLNILGTLKTPRQRDDKNDNFRDEMKRDLAELSDALTLNKVQLMLKPVIVATVTGAVVTAAGATGAAAILAAGTAAIGSTATEVADKLSKLFEAGFGFNTKQREAMAKHPMAYMYQLRA